mmetsp:Transcript_30202/g.81164  ORF Transcript_30202/g.81164 Transcript_30202/m.81164 type:complete len:201 (+) Transcript_30202:434-1036(+)
MAATTARVTIRDKPAMRRVVVRLVSRSSLRATPCSETTGSTVTEEVPWRWGSASASADSSSSTTTSGGTEASTGVPVTCSSSTGVAKVVLVSISTARSSGTPRGRVMRVVTDTRSVSPLPSWSRRRWPKRADQSCTSHQSRSAPVKSQMAAAQSTRTCSSSRSDTGQKTTKVTKIFTNAMVGGPVNVPTMPLPMSQPSST